MHSGKDYNMCDGEDKTKKTIFFYGEDKTKKTIFLMMKTIFPMVKTKQGERRRYGM